MSPTERMTPFLPCRSIDDQIAVYETLGFEDAALAVGDDALAGSLLKVVAGVALGPDDREALADELARADDVRKTLA